MYAHDVLANRKEILLEMYFPLIVFSWGAYKKIGLLYFKQPTVLKLKPTFTKHQIPFNLIAYYLALSNIDTDKRAEYY